MGEKKLLTPQFRVQLGNYILESGLKVECNSSTERRSNWAMILLDSRLRAVLKLEHMQQAIISLGYDGDYDTLLDGYIIHPFENTDTEIKVLDDTVYLYDTYITETFLDCTPQDIICYVLKLSGITNMTLSNVRFLPRKVFSIVSQNVMDVIENVNRTWGIDAVYYFKGKKFFWGIDSGQDTYYLLQEGKNITALHKFVGEVEIETIGIPWIHQGETVLVEHTEYTGRAKITSVAVKHNEQGFVRMYLTFKG